MRDQVVQRAALETGQGRNVEELEARAQGFAVVAYRLPHCRVLGVVVDDQDFVVRIVEGGQGVEGLFDHFRRLVVARHMDRHFRAVVRIAFHGQEFTPTLVGPDCFRQLMGFGQQHNEHAQGAECQQHPDRHAEPGAVLLAVVVADPDQHRPAQERNEGQEGTAPLAQGRAIDHQQGQGQQRKHH